LLSNTQINNLTIKLESTVRKTFEGRIHNENQHEQDAQYTNQWIKQSFASYARGQQTDFGWDWSPALSPRGIFGDIELTRNSFVLENPLIQQEITFDKSTKTAVSVSLALEL